MGWDYSRKVSVLRFVASALAKHFHVDRTVRLPERAVGFPEFRQLITLLGGDDPPVARLQGRLAHTIDFVATEAVDLIRLLYRGVAVLDRGLLIDCFPWLRAGHRLGFRRWCPKLDLIELAYGI